MMTGVKGTELVFMGFFLFHGCFAVLKCNNSNPISLYNSFTSSEFNTVEIPPIKQFSDTLIVNVSITVLRIIELDEKAQVITTVIKQVFEWDIPWATWAYNDSGTDRFPVLLSNLWIPDILITENTDKDEIPKTPYAYLFNTGHVYNDNPVKVKSSCQMWIYAFPFDVQNCSLTFGSYLLYDKDIKMGLGVNQEDTLARSQSVLQTDGEWHLADITATESTIQFNGANYSAVQFFIILRRRPLSYVVNLLVPSSFLVMVDMFSFALPPQSMDRSSFKMTLILGYTVFLLIVSDLLPITGETTPLINVFFSISLALMVSSLLETQIITNLQCHSGRPSAPPLWFSTLVLRYLAVLVFFPPKKKTNLTSVFHVEANGDSTLNSSTSTSSTSTGERPVVSDVTATKKSPDTSLEELKKLRSEVVAIRHQVGKHDEDNISQEWRMIGEVLDRMLFSLYVIFITVSFITLTCIWLWNDSYRT